MDRGGKGLIEGNKEHFAAGIRGQMMDQTQVKDLLRLAIEGMIRADKEQAPDRKLLLTAERNISAHLRDHIRQTLARCPLYKSYQVDHEYNRMGIDNSPKRSQKILTSKGRKGNFIPDIAVHKRGVEAGVDRSANLVVVEVKRITTFAGSPEKISNKHVRRALLKDLCKLKILQDENDAFMYEHSASVVFSNEKKAWIAWVAMNGSPFEILTDSHLSRD